MEQIYWCSFIILLWIESGLIEALIVGAGHVGMAVKIGFLEIKSDGVHFNVGRTTDQCMTLAELETEEQSIDRKGCSEL